MGLKIINLGKIIRLCVLN